MADGDYQVLVADAVQEFLTQLDGKSERIVRDNLGKLTEPHPGQGQGDKERITWRGDDVYRLHIGRTWTAFYDIDEGGDVVKVLEIMPIDDAHKEYGSLD